MLHNPEFVAEVKVQLHAEELGDLAGVGLLGHEYSYLALEQETNMQLVLRKGSVQEISFAGQAVEKSTAVIEIPKKQTEVWIRIHLCRDENYFYEYSLDGKDFYEIGQRFRLCQCTWVGARLALFSCNYRNEESKGYGMYEYVYFK